MKKLTRTKESATRKKIDIWLNNLNWNTDEESPDCNVYTERLKTTEQQKKLKGKEPDYSLYKSETNEIIGIIEAKRKGKDLDDTLDDAITKYVKPLTIPIIFVSDGTFFKTWHIKDDKELTVDGEPVNELLSEKMILRFIKEGSEIESIVSKEVEYTREQLINVFKWADNLLRKEGIREGFDRFIEFGNLLFLKLISEMEIDREKNNEKRILERKYCWGSFAELEPETMMEYINGTVLPHLVQKYNHSGDVFQNKLGITNPMTLKQITNKLTKLTLINIESDIKGDAFEYFLKNAVTVGNDLGEYFTPRHIVRLMTKLVNPQFGDKIYDPTCGTGGFLIEAFRHIKKSCKHTKENLKILQKKTIFGRELTNTTRIAKMNMILTGDGHTNIEQMDSLEKPIKNKYDVVLANPPYGQTTDWGDLYPIHSTNADCVFIQHILQSLNENGRACIIVPEGVLFRPGPDQKTREYILRKINLIAIISLPQGIFNPYTDSKTNIIIFDKKKKSTKKIWFYDLQNDGFDLGRRRKPIDQNDIPDLNNKWINKDISENSWSATFEEIESQCFDLRIKLYKPTKEDDIKDKIPFNKIIKPVKEKIIIQDKKEYMQVTVKMHGKGAVLRNKIVGSKIKTKNQYIAREGQLIISKIDARNGALAIIPKKLDKSIVTSDFPLFEVDYSQIRRKYIEYSIKYGLFYKSLSISSKGTTNRKRIKPDDLLNLTINIPTLIEQDKIIKNIETIESDINKIEKKKIEKENSISKIMRKIDMI